MESFKLKNFDATGNDEHLQPLISPETASSSSFRDGTGGFEHGTSRSITPETDANELAEAAPGATNPLPDFSRPPATPLRDLLQEERRSSEEASGVWWNDITLIRCNVEAGYYEELATQQPLLQELPTQPPNEESSTREQNLMDDMQTQLDTDLLESIRTKKFEEFVKLLMNGANPNTKNAVHEAAAVQGDYLRLLLKRGAVRDTPDEYGKTPLHTAVWARETANVDLLLNFPIYMNSYEHVEASTSSKKRFDKKKFVNCTVKGTERKKSRCALKEGFTALHIAAVYIHPECIPLLLSAGADPNARDVDNYTPLDVVGVTPAFNFYLEAEKFREVGKRFKEEYSDQSTGPNPVPSSPDAAPAAPAPPFYRDFNAEKFKEVIKQLVKGGSELHRTKIVTRDEQGRSLNRTTPLHVAVKLQALEAIKELIDRGVSVTSRSKSGLNALHECVKMKFEKGLEILANHAKNDVDVTDQWGSSTLRRAIDEAWMPGVCIALAAGADVKNGAKHGDTPIHAAARSTNTNVFFKMLSAAKQKGVLNIKNDKGETPLYKAVAAGRDDYVKALLNEGASIKLCLPNFTNVFHIAAKYGNVEVLSVLFFHNLKRETKIMAQVMINERVRETGFTPLHFAVNNNHYECAKFLLHVGADVIGRGWSSRPYHNETPLHLAAQNNHVEMAKLLIKYDNFQSTECRYETNLVRHRNIEEIDIHGWYPIHTAAYHASNEIIPVLLQAGSDLSAKTEEVSEMHVQSSEQTDPYVEDNTSQINQEDEAIQEKKTAVEMVINNIPKPTEFLEDIFDSYISTNGHELQNADEVINLDFSALMPLSKIRNQQSFTFSARGWGYFQENTFASEIQIDNMNVITALVKTGNTYGQRRLLVHPLLESFLYLRWKDLQVFFYVILACHALFVLILTIFVVTVFLDRDAKNQYPTWLEPTIGYMLYVPIFILLLQEILYINIKRSNYFRNLESWIKIGSIVLAFILPPALTTEPATEWSRHVATAALLLSWIEMMLIIARFPKWGYYVYMFGKIASKVIKILLTFAFIVVGFSFCFMIQFKSKPPFESVWASIVKTMVMMTSEFDYGNLFDDKHFQDTTDVSATITRSFFVVFIMLVAIVLMNLMLSVSVNDINNLEVEGNLGRLAKQAEFLKTLESLLSDNIFSKNRIPRIINSILTRKLMQRNIPRILEIYPAKPNSRYMKMLPSHIKESIFKKCSAQVAKKKQLDQEAEKKELEKKLEDNYDKIIKTIEKETKSLREDLDCNKKESVEALREVLDYIKQESAEARKSGTKIDDLYAKVIMELESKKNYRRMSM